MKRRLGIGVLVCAGVLAGKAMWAQGPGGQPRAVLMALDTDHDGTLSAVEIGAAAGVLSRMDADGDGQLTSIEFLARPVSPAAGDPDEMVTRLMVFDRNKDGVLTADELPERLAGMMARADTNHDGKLTADEIRASTKSQAGPRGRQMRGGQVTRMDPILNALDADHDGVLSASEMANAPLALKTLDANGDGMLSAEEIKMRQATPEERTAHMMDEWDTNKDGKLTKAECPDRMQDQFEKIDTNKDGVLDAAELTAFFAAQPVQRPRS